jgi:cyanate permease
MTRLRFLVPLFTLVALAMMAGSALAKNPTIPIEPVPEPSSIIVFGGLAAIGLAGWFWQRRRRRP